MIKPILYVLALLFVIIIIAGTLFIIHSPAGLDQLSFIKTGLASLNPQILVIESVNSSAKTTLNTLTVYSNGTVTFKEEQQLYGIQYGNHTKTNLNISQLKSTLAQIGDVSTIPINADCVKSVSYGTTTMITYRGRTSGDLQCLDSQKPIYGQLIYQLNNLKSLTMTGKSLDQMKL